VRLGTQIGSLFSFRPWFGPFVDVVVPGVDGEQSKSQGAQRRQIMSKALVASDFLMANIFKHSKK
jgi:hypothetical protein